MTSKKFKDLIIFFAVMFFTIILELALDKLHVKDENIYLVFVLAILIVIIESKSILYGLFASIVSVLSFNFFITEPKFTFVVNDPNYYVSFAMFIVVTFMVSSLVIQLQKQIKISKDNEHKINVLYNVSTELLHSKNNEDIYEKIIGILKEQIDGNISIILKEKNIYGESINIEDYAEAYEFVISHNKIIDKNNKLYEDLEAYVFPIKSKAKDYGILVISNVNNEIDTLFVENVIEEVVVALDKNYISIEKEQTKLEVEKEKFKTSLLRGLSHDLKTPLTMIQSGSEFLKESFNKLNDESRIGIINDIYDESVDLSNFVNNLLDLTKFENKNLILNKTSESADDIIFDVLQKTKRRLNNVEVKVNHPNDVVMVYGDISLLTQVFINLIDNAVVHTKQNTSIIIDYYKKDNYTYFVIKDNGGGISEDKINNIFDDFYSLAQNQDHVRSHGLGLSLCKAIVEAHGGKIWVENNDIGGASFSFTIKDKDE